MANEIKTVFTADTAPLKSGVAEAQVEIKGLRATVGGLVTAGAISAAVQGIRDMSDLAFKLNSLAMKTGTSLKEIQQLYRFSQGMGANIDELNYSFMLLAQNIGDVKNMSDRTKNALKTIKIEPKDLDGKGMVERWRLVLTGLSKVNDKMAMTSAGLALIGERWRIGSNIIARGALEMENAFGRGRMKMVASDEAITNLERLNLAIKDLAVTGQFAGMELLGEASVTMSEQLQKAADTLDAMQRSGALRELAGTLEGIATGVMTVIDTLFRVLRSRGSIWSILFDLAVLKLMMKGAMNIMEAGAEGASKRVRTSLDSQGSGSNMTGQSYGGTGVFVPPISVAGQAAKGTSIEKQVIATLKKQKPLPSFKEVAVKGGMLSTEMAVEMDEQAERITSGKFKTHSALIEAAKKNPVYAAALKKAFAIKIENLTTQIEDFQEQIREARRNPTIIHGRPVAMEHTINQELDRLEAERMLRDNVYKDLSGLDAEGRPALKPMMAKRRKNLERGIAEKENYINTPQYLEDVKNLNKGTEGFEKQREATLDATAKRHEAVVADRDISVAKLAQAEQAATGAVAFPDEDVQEKMVAAREKAAGVETSGKSAVASQVENVDKVKAAGLEAVEAQFKEAIAVEEAGKKASAAQLKEAIAVEAAGKKVIDAKLKEAIAVEAAGKKAVEAQRANVSKVEEAGKKAVEAQRANVRKVEEAGKASIADQVAKVTAVEDAGKKAVEAQRAKFIATPTAKEGARVAVVVNKAQRDDAAAIKEAESVASKVEEDIAASRLEAAKAEQTATKNNAAARAAMVKAEQLAAKNNDAARAAGVAVETVAADKNAAAQAAAALAEKTALDKKNAALAKVGEVSRKAEENNAAALAKVGEVSKKAALDKTEADTRLAEKTQETVQKYRDKSADAEKKVAASAERKAKSEAYIVKLNEKIANNKKVIAETEKKIKEPGTQTPERIAEETKQLNRLKMDMRQLEDEEKMVRVAERRLARPLDFKRDLKIGWRRTQSARRELIGKIESAVDTGRNIIGRPGNLAATFRGETSDTGRSAEYQQRYASASGFRGKTMAGMQNLGAIGAEKYYASISKGAQIAAKGVGNAFVWTMQKTFGTIANMWDSTMSQMKAMLANPFMWVAAIGAAKQFFDYLEERYAAMERNENMAGLKSYADKLRSLETLNSKISKAVSEAQSRVSEEQRRSADELSENLQKIEKAASSVGALREEYKGLTKEISDANKEWEQSNKKVVEIQGDIRDMESQNIKETVKENSDAQHKKTREQTDSMRKAAVDARNAIKDVGKGFEELSDIPTELIKKLAVGSADAYQQLMAMQRPKNYEEKQLAGLKHFMAGGAGYGSDAQRAMWLSPLFKRVLASRQIEAEGESKAQRLEFKADVMEFGSPMRSDEQRQAARARQDAGEVTGPADRRKAIDSKREELVQSLVERRRIEMSQDIRKQRQSTIEAGVAPIEAIINRIMDVAKAKNTEGQSLVDFNKDLDTRLNNISQSMMSSQARIVDNLSDLAKGATDIATKFEAAAIRVDAATKMLDSIVAVGERMNNVIEPATERTIESWKTSKEGMRMMEDVGIAPEKVKNLSQIKAVETAYVNLEAAKRPKLHWLPDLDASGKTKEKAAPEELKARDTLVGGTVDILAGASKAAAENTGSWFKSKWSYPDQDAIDAAKKEADATRDSIRFETEAGKAPMSPTVYSEEVSKIENTFKPGAIDAWREKKNREKEAADKELLKQGETSGSVTASPTSPAFWASVVLGSVNETSDYAGASSGNAMDKWTDARRRAALQAEVIADQNPVAPEAPAHVVAAPHGVPDETKRYAMPGSFPSEEDGAAQRPQRYGYTLNKRGVAAGKFSGMNPSQVKTVGQMDEVYDFWMKNKNNKNTEQVQRRREELQMSIAEQNKKISSERAFDPKMLNKTGVAAGKFSGLDIGEVKTVGQMDEVNKFYKENKWRKDTTEVQRRRDEMQKRVRGMSDTSVESIDRAAAASMSGTITDLSETNKLLNDIVASLKGVTIVKTVGSTRR